MSNKFLGTSGLRKLIELFKSLVDEAKISIAHLYEEKVNTWDIVDDTQNGLAPQVEENHISDTPLSDGDLVLTYRDEEGAMWSRVDIYELPSPGQN